MRKAVIIGHYAFGMDYLDGQTVKTKVLTNALCKSFEDQTILKVDTHGWSKNPVKFAWRVLSTVSNSKNVVLLPAQNGLRVIAPLVYCAKLVSGKSRLHYVVIGGWLPEFLQNRKHLKKMLQRFDGIYVETQTMKQALEQQGFSNVLVMPNCKELTPIMPEDLSYKKEEPYPLCTFSRVMKEKGIEDAVEAVKVVNARFGRTVYELDIYGQVDPNQTEWFSQLQQEFPEYVKYKGAVPYDESVSALKDYLGVYHP